jgi:poly-gamma-glutamate synthesis protein (capsule biosynthesis protein)
VYAGWTPDGRADRAVPCPGVTCITVTMTGDVLLHPALWQQARRDARASGRRAEFDFRPLLAGQRRLLAQSDLAICHLETPLARWGGPYRGYPRFDVPPQIASDLVATGYDACTTASNHTLDQGIAGIRRTLAVMDAAHLRHTGSARSRREREQALTFDVRGTTVALLSYTYGLNGLRRPRGQGWWVNLINPTRIRADARAARAHGADLVVVALHWGTEYVHPPTTAQRGLARQLLSGSDIDLLYGHHAHVVQPVERINGKWVVYGLGNSVAAQSVRRTSTQEGLLVRVQLFSDARGVWHDGRLDWVPSLVKRTAPYRWRDLDRALTKGHLKASTRRAFERSRLRTKTVVESRGAALQGAHELAPPR